MIDQSHQPGRGCLFYTGIALALSVMVLIAAAYLGYRYGRGLIVEFTGTEPMPIPAAELSPGALQQLRDRIVRFSEDVEQGKATGPLILSASEANGLMAANPELMTVHGKMFVEIHGTNLEAQFSIPAEDLGFKPLQGRFINATGEFQVAFSNGVLNVNADSFQVRGKAFPPTFMGRVRPQNFAYRLNHDPRAKDFLTRLSDVRVTNSEILLIPKKTAD